MGLSSAYSFLQTDKGYVGLSSYERKMITKVDRFESSGTWTVPAGVTYAVAHIRGAGGGTGTAGSTGGAGGTSSVAFASGTISATGGNLANNANAWAYNIQVIAGVANSGQGAYRSAQSDPGPGGTGQSVKAGDGAYVVAGADVTSGASITVTVGGGGTAGTNSAAGGSGYVWIEYQVAL